MSDKIQDAATSMVANLKANTGKTLEQWHAALTKKRFTPSSKHGDIMKFLKADSGVSHGYANLIALKFRENKDADEQDLVVAQYSGDKAALLPIYEKLIKAIAKFGKDVELAPKKTYVSVRRSKQFAVIQPSTKTRVDVGINLKGTVPSGRLEASGSFNTMVSHRVRVESVAQVDAQLLTWLKQAYSLA